MGLDKLEIEKHLIENEILKNQVKADCKNISIPVIGDPTWTTQCEMNNLFSSAGRATGGSVSDAGGETINVTAGTGFIKATDDDTAELLSFDWAASNGIAVATDTSVFVGVKYNSGSPIIETRATDSYDLDTEFRLATVVNEGGTLHILNSPWWVTDGTTNIIERIHGEGHIIRDKHIGGLIIGDAGTRYITVTAGKLWHLLTEFDIPAYDTSGADTVELYYYSTDAGWTDSDVSQWDKVQYNDTTQTAGNELVNFGNNNYGNVWVYAEADDLEIALVYPQAQYTNVASAEAEATPSNIPTHIQENGILIGRIIIQQGNDTPIDIQSAFDTVFTSSQAADHGNLAGLSDDDHTQYARSDGTLRTYLRLPLSSVATDTTEGNMRYNETDNILEIYNGTGWIQMGVQKVVKVTDTTQAEGNNSITSFEDKVNIKRIKVDTTSTDWALTLYEKDDYSTDPFVVMVHGNTDKVIYLDHLYEDQDASTELHYNFTSASGAETHDIEVRGLLLR